MEEPTFDSDLIHSIMKRIWTLRTLERENVATNDALDSEVGAGSSKKNRTTSANASALKLTCELLRVFVTEAVQRAVAIAETEGDGQIEATHLENNGKRCRIFRLTVGDTRWDYRRYRPTY